VETADQPRLDGLGTLLLALTLAAYVLAVTAARGGFGLVNAGVLSAATLGAGLFLWVEATLVHGSRPIGDGDRLRRGMRPSGGRACRSRRTGSGGIAFPGSGTG
jgi:hypothetical protein